MQGDPTTDAILSAALTTFGQVGFKATTLSKVAKVAGVSRPTLYARYPDKTHLFRAVIEQAYGESIAAAMRTAKAEGMFSDILSQVLLDYYGALFDQFHGLPQIDELILMQSEHAQDIVANARNRMKRLLTRLLRSRIEGESIKADALAVPVAQLVELLRLTPLSLKQATTTRAQYRKGLRSLAKVVAATLRADPE